VCASGLKGELKTKLLLSGGSRTGFAGVSYFVHRSTKMCEKVYGSSGDGGMEVELKIKRQGDEELDDVDTQYTDWVEILDNEVIARAI
jgi:hypothetical protein